MSRRESFNMSKDYDIELHGSCDRSRKRRTCRSDLSDDPYLACQECCLAVA